MISTAWYAALLLLASAGVACLVYAVAAFFAPEWAAAYLWPLLMAGFGVAPVLAGAAWLRRWWEREGVRLENDRARTWALNTETARKEAQLDAALQAAGGAEADDSPRRATAVAVLRFFRAGDALGFALDGLVAAGVVTQPTWQRLKDFYLIWPEKSPVLVDRGGNVGTVWGPAWTLGRVGDLVALGELPLPSGAPPDVGVFTPERNTQQSKQRKSRAAGAVVDSTAREVGQ